MKLSVSLRILKQSLPFFIISSLFLVGLFLWKSECIIEDKDFLKILHFSLLLNDFPPETEPLFKLDMFYTPDTINFLLATKYYNLDVKKIIEHLDKKKNSTK